MAASSAYSRSVRWYGPSWIPGTMALTVSIRQSMMQLNRSGAATQPCLTPLEMVNQSESVVDADTAGCVCVQSFSYSHNLGWDADGVENVP